MYVNEVEVNVSKKMFLIAKAQLSNVNIPYNCDFNHCDLNRFKAEEIVDFINEEIKRWNGQICIILKIWNIIFDIIAVIPATKMNTSMSKMKCLKWN